MANFNIPLDPSVISNAASAAGNLPGSSSVTGTLNTYNPNASMGNTDASTIVGTITNNIVSPTIISTRLSSTTVNTQAIVADTQVLFDAHGFIFRNNNGIITPINKSLYTYSVPLGNYNTSFTIPANVYYIFVKMWGAGGGGGAYGGWRQGSFGGGGGFSQGLIPVTPGATFSIRAGDRGLSRSNSNAFPDGGKATSSGSDNRYAGNGGGSSSVAVSTINSGAWCMYAGAGGGGGSVNGYAKNGGGAGGGTTGQPGQSTGYTGISNYGKGGTQTTGGAAGVGDSSYNGSNGAYNSGGNYYGPTDGSYCGGGGGGYYGGGAGSYYTGNSSMGGGGGGSGFIHSSILMGITLCGSLSKPANADDPLLGQDSLNQYACGGDEDGYGGYGLVALYY
jgi:hypothetical protein